MPPRTLLAPVLLFLSQATWSHAEPLRAVAVVTSSGQTVAGTVSSADAAAILFQPKDGSPMMIPLSTLSSLKIEEPKDWSSALGALRSGKFEEAAKLFAQLSQAHQGIRPLKDSYGSLAKLYHLRALRGAEKWDSLAAELKLLPGAPLVLTTSLDQELKDLYAYAMISSKDAVGLGAYLSSWEDKPAAKDQVPSLKPTPPTRQASLHLLRGHYLELSGKPSALTEYRKAHLLAHGHDSSISLPALRKVIQALEKSAQNPAELAALKKLLQDLTSSS